MYFQHLLHNGAVRVRGLQLGKLRHVHNSFGSINKVTGADVHKCTGIIIINVINPSAGDDCIMVQIDKHTFVLSAQECKSIILFSITEGSFPVLLGSLWT